MTGHSRPVWLAGSGRGRTSQGTALTGSFVLDVVARRRVGLQALIGNRLAADVAEPVGALVQAPKRVVHVPQLRLDLLEHAQVPAPVMGLGAGIGGALVDHAQLTEIVLPQLIQALVLEVILDGGEAVALIVENRSGLGVVHDAGPYPSGGAPQPAITGRDDGARTLRRDEVSTMIRLCRRPGRHQVLSCAPPLPPGRAIDLPGRGTTFIRDAAGPKGAPVLFLLHGLGATADLNWWFAYERLSQHYRVLAIDHRGHGRGIRSGARFRLADCADDVVAVADQLGIDEFIPVGYSMGGPISQLIWHRHPERVVGLVLCATSRDFHGSPRDWATFAVMPWMALSARAIPWSPILAIGARYLARQATDEPYADWMLEEFRRSDVVSIFEAAASLGRFSSREWISTVDIPVGVVATSLDSLVPVRRQVKLAMAVPTATIHVAEGDHYLARGEQDGLVTAIEEACALVVRRSRPPVRRPRRAAPRARG